MSHSFDVISAIIDYETGMLDDDGVIELFQYLLDSGMIRSLQGHYQRTAEVLIDANLVFYPYED